MTEILSPAGNMESVIAAVRSGADAIYLGTGNFNARRNAENFDGDKLFEAVAYCHGCGVKVYLALNTQVYCKELKSAKMAASIAAKIGVDGIIAADLGLCRYIKNAIPDMPLHASTQMTVHTKEALYILKELGFCRVVPAREMSKKELIPFCETAKKLGIEVEVFIHGALCMSMSGQCLLSANLGGRSGNRGLCAGTCRLPFSVGTATHALSLKDMSHIEYINELKSIGVTSFKIEGRMKPPEYVGAATAACRSMLDKNTVEADLLYKLQSIFSRSGFCDGYYTGKIGPEMFGYRTESDEILSKEVQKSIHALYRTERMSVPVTAAFFGGREKTELTLFDGKDSVTVSTTGGESAKTRETTLEEVAENLKKLGGTPFYLSEISGEIESGIFISAAVINFLRRSAAQMLLQKRKEPMPYEILPYECKKTQAEKDRRPLIFARFLSADNLPDDSALENIDAVILPLNLINAYKGAKKVICELPRGTQNDEAIKSKLINIPKNTTLLCENYCGIFLAKKLGFPFLAGSSFNAYNNESAEVLYSLGAKAVLLSYEMKLSELPEFSGSVGLTVYGKTPLMLTRSCPIKNAVGCKSCTHKIVDRKNIAFPVYCGGGFSEIFNSRPIYLADRLNEFSGFNFLVLNFTDETRQDVANTLNSYANSLLPTGEYTRGLYYKGVL